MLNWSLFGQLQQHPRDKDELILVPQAILSCGLQMALQMALKVTMMAHSKNGSLVKPGVGDPVPHGGTIPTPKHGLDECPQG